MVEVNRLLIGIENGDPLATSQLLPLVYGELKRIVAAKMAREQFGQTLQTRGIVHLAYLRLVGDDSPQSDARGKFYVVAAEAMRRLLVGLAQRNRQLNRVGKLRRVDLTSIEDPLANLNVDIEALDVALRELESEQPEKTALAKLRFFAGLSIEDAAQALGISTSTALLRWRYSRVWLADRLAREGGKDDTDIRSSRLSKYGLDPRTK